MAQSTYGTYLMKYNSDASPAAYEKLVDIVDYSDLEEQPDTLDTTTLSDDTETSIPSIKRLGGGVSFTVNLEHAKFLELRQIAEARTINEYALWFSNQAFDASVFNGSDGANEFAVYFNATMSIVQNGGGVDEVVRAKLTLFPQKNESLGKVMSYVRPTTHI